MWSVKCGVRSVKCKVWSVECKVNKLRWYPQQPQRFTFTNLSEACCEAKRCTKASQTFSGTQLNLTWLCTKASLNLSWNLLRSPVEPNLALHQSLPDLFRNLRNLLWKLVEPEPTPTPVHTGARLKSPQAHAAGEKCRV